MHSELVWERCSTGVGYCSCTLNIWGIHRKSKTSFERQEICRFPAWPKLSAHIKQEIIPTIKFVYEEDEEHKLIGVVFHPVHLLKKHMSRFLQRKELEGMLFPPGNYKIVCKVYKATLL